MPDVLVHLAVVVVVLGPHARQRRGRLVQRAADGRRQSPENLGICEGFAIGSGQFTNSFSASVGLVGNHTKEMQRHYFRVQPHALLVKNHLQTCQIISYSKLNYLLTFAQDLNI